MIKQWIYRNGEKPFSVTEIELPNGNVRLLSVSNNGVLRDYFCDGLQKQLLIHEYDLIPYEPYADFKIDDKVYVKDTSAYKYQQVCGHFAGVNKNGQPTTFVDGRTSFTEKETLHWLYCEKANKEDK
jgi:hypothetical protein